MISVIKFILFGLIFITTFLEGKLQTMPWSSFIQNKVLNFLTPKDPGIVRVRKMDNTVGIIDIKVLDFIGLVERFNYPAEEHNVTTEDGYNLKIHRIPGSPLLDNKREKKIALIQHGLLCSSDSWVLYGPNKDLAFLLADQGYDVWIGNMRGNTYCRSHVNMTTYNPKFWQFSFHEIGTKDLPAMIDYILNYTNQKDLYYIGHSMGSTSLFVLLSLRPEYNMKIKLVVGLAPGYLINTTSTFRKTIDIFPLTKKILQKNEIYDFLPQSLALVIMGRTLCNKNSITQIFCIAIIFSLSGSNPAQLNITSLPDIISHTPAGCSVQSIEHYYQHVRTGDFRNYDYGVTENYKRYKQKIPPKYDLKKITAPMILFYAANDIIITKENVLKFAKQLPNMPLIEEVPHKFFTHLDFMWAIDARTLLYDRLLTLMQKFDKNQNKSVN